MLQSFDKLKVHIPDILNIKKSVHKKENISYKCTNPFSNYFGAFLTT